jgi:hypothetical protein
VRNVWLLRVVLVVVAVFSIRAGVTSWVDHDVIVTYSGPPTADHPDGAPTQLTTDYRCAAPLSSSSWAHPVEAVPGPILSSSHRPCTKFRTGRQVLVYTDLGVLAAVLLLSFGRVRHLLRVRFASP